MDPSQYPSPNNVDDDMPMFGGGGGGGARWPGHEDYRVETPGSVGSTFVSDSEFDPFFGTEEYRVEDMEPSCGQPPAPVRPPPKKGKKKMARKEKLPSVPVPVPHDEPNEEYATGRTDYELDEYLKVAQCWVDVSEDSIASNNQTSARMWDRIEERYNEVKPKWAFKRTKVQLRKCWDRIKLHVNNFCYIYNRNRDGRASGESMEDVLNKSLSEYQRQFGQFKLYNVWLILKDKGKFNGGIPVGSSAPKRTKNTAAGDYTSSGPSPVDLNAEPEGSSGTPTSTFRRPIGAKAAKAQAKGTAKAGASGSAAPPQAAPAPSVQLMDRAIEEFGGYREVVEYRFILDAQNSLRQETDSEARQRTKNMIKNLAQRLNLDD